MSLAGMRSVQEDFRHSEGWGGWLKKEPTSALKVSGLACGYRHDDFTGAVPDELVSLGQFSVGLF